ncbi:MAG: ESPR-type extended signal peptide-containing protein, partial [Acinetobacter sp.]
MNRIFKIIWNKSTGQMVVVSELAKQAISQNANNRIPKKMQNHAASIPCKIALLKPTVLAIAMLMSHSTWAGSTCDLTPVNTSSTADGAISLSCGISNKAVENFGVSVGIANSSIGKGSTAMGASSAYDDFFFIRTPVVTKNGAGQIDSIDGVKVGTSATDIFDLFTNPNFFALTIDGQDISEATKQAFLSAVFGGGNLALGDGSSAVGVQNVASGKESSAVGFANGAHGFHSSAVGHSNAAHGSNSNAMGSNNVAIGQSASAFGSGSDQTGTKVPVITFNAGQVNSIDGVAVLTTATSWDDLKANPSKLTAVNGAVGLSAAQKQAFIQSFAYGGNVAFGDASSAVGSQNLALGTNSSALGYRNTATSFSSTAVGNGNTAASSYSSAVGYQNTASGVTSSAFGYANTASGLVGVAMGHQNTAAGSFSTALGVSNGASGDFSSAVGLSNAAIGQSASAVGSGSDPTASRTPVITLNAGLVNSIDGVAVVSTATSWNDLLLNPTKLTSVNGVALNAAQQQDFVKGIRYGGNIAFGKTSSAVGSQNLAIGDSSSAVGSNNTVLDASSNAFGRNNKITSAGGTAAGLNNIVSGAGGTALGLNNTASGDYSSAVGSGNTASALNSSALGNSSQATANNATAL